MIMVLILDGNYFIVCTRAQRVLSNTITLGRDVSSTVQTLSYLKLK